MCKTFKARIHGSYTLIYDTPDNPRHEVFVFTKNKIQFISPDPKREYFVGVPLVHGFTHGTEYDFEIDESGDDKKFIIYINRDKKQKAALAFDSWVDKFNCQWVHKKTWYHDNKKWFWRLVVGTLIVAMLTWLLTKAGCQTKKESNQSKAQEQFRQHKDLCIHPLVLFDKTRYIHAKLFIA